MKLTRIFLILFLLLSSIQPLFSQQTPAPRLEHTLTRVGEQIFMFGGDFYDNGSHLNNELWEYDQDSDSWTLLDPAGTAPDPVSGHAAVAYQDTLYIIGGQTDAGFPPDSTMTLFQYSVTENEWTQTSIVSTDAPLLTTDLAAQVIGEFIYINGGTGLAGTTDETWRFNLNTHIWEQLAASPFKEYGHCSAVFGEKFYLLRGLGMGHLIAAYDPETNTWETITPQINNDDNTNMPTGAYKAACWFNESGVYSIGGNDVVESLNSHAGKQNNLQKMEVTPSAFSYNFLLNVWCLLDCFDSVYNAAAIGLDNSLALTTGGWDGTKTVWTSRLIDCFGGQEPQYTVDVTINPQSAADKGAKVNKSPSGPLYQPGQVVSLTAIDGDEGWVFKEYTGDVATANREASLTMTGEKLAKKVTAHFVQPELIVTSPGPERKVVAPEDAHDNLVKIIQIELKANDVDDWLLNALKFKNLVDKQSIKKAKITTQNGMIEGVINADTTEISFTFTAPILIAKGTTVALDMFYEIFLPEEDRTCRMTAAREYRVSVDKAADVSAAPYTYPDGLKTVQAPIYSNRTFVACVENQDLWGFLDIHDALDSDKTIEDDVLTVYKGNYTESEKISKAVTLKSKEGAENTIIKKSGTSDTWIFDLGSDDIIIDGFTFSDAESAINSADANEKCIIKNCKLENISECGINLKNSKSFIVEKNTFISNPRGIELSATDSCKIDDNTFTLSDSSQILVKINKIGSGNSISGNKDDKIIGKILYMPSIFEGFSDSPLLIENNTFSYLKLENTKNVTFSGNTVSEINILGNSEKNKIIDNKIRNSKNNGIYIFASNNNTIELNEITGADKNGIKVGDLGMTHTASNIIKENKISGCKQSGIHLTHASETHVLKNTIYSNNLHGINSTGGYSEYSNNSLIKRNNVYKNGGDGINLNITQNCRVERNTVWDNGKSGIVTFRCENSKLINNRIYGHKTGGKRSGIFIDSQLKPMRIQANTIYNNCTGINIDSGNDKKLLTIKNNKVSWNFCLFTGIHIESGNAELTGNHITENNGAGIALYNDAAATISGNNIYNNPDLAVLNENVNNNLQADNNYWGSDAGPGEGDFSSGVYAAAWLDAPISMVISTENDTVNAVSGQTDSVDIALQNYVLTNDEVELTVTDEKGWLLNSGTTNINLVDTSFTSFPIKFAVPADAEDKFNNKVTISAVSLTDPEMAAVNSIYIINYTPQLAALEITPDSLTIGYGDTLQFNSLLVDQHENIFTGEYQIEWAASSGMIDSTGVFVAPNQDTIVTVTARDLTSDMSGMAKLSIRENPNTPGMITITPDSISTQPNSTLQFFAKGYDENGFYVVFEKIWISDAGTITNTGMLTTAETPGIYSVQVSDKYNESTSAVATVIIEPATDIEECDTPLPAVYLLKPNYPNPFNPSTTIRYELPQPSRTKLIVYNVVGQKVAALVNNEKLNAGSYEIKWNAAQFASGIYFVVMDAQAISSDDQFHSVEKMMLLK